MERVLVIGGTRGTGALAAPLLLQEGYRVRALARSPARARAALPAEVEIVAGDLMRPDTLLPAVSEVDHILFTAGVTGATAGEPVVRAVTYDGVCATLIAAGEAQVAGRLVYMTTVGLTTGSIASRVLNLLKRNLLHWRRQAEAAIRAGGRDYTIVRTGLLTNEPPGRRALVVTQRECSLSPATRISRGDVARALVEALRRPELSRTTFNLVGAARGERERTWDDLFRDLRPDA
jgi:uncharacterized protein YbjT (DUF2867 family)